MAQVVSRPGTIAATQPPQSEVQVWERLAYLQAEWDAIPQLAAEWPEWDETSRLHFTIDWPVRESYLQQMESWHTAGYLSAVQQRVYQALVVTVAELRPVLVHLLDS